MRDTLTKEDAPGSRRVIIYYYSLPQLLSWGRVRSILESLVFESVRSNTLKNRDV